MVTSIMENGDNSLMTSMFTDHESGTGLTEDSQMEQDEDDVFWTKQKEQINNLDKPWMKLLDDDQEQVPESRQTPEGQVRNSRDHRLKLQLTNSVNVGLCRDRGDSRHAPRTRPRPGRGVHRHGRDQ